MKASKRQRDAAAGTSDLVSASAAAEVAHVQLMTNCTIRDCGALKADLSAVLAAAEPVSIDVSALERIDTAAVQLLCAFVRDRKQRQLEVRWSGTSPALTEASRLLGVDAVLGMGGAPLSGGTVSQG